MNASNLILVYLFLFKFKFLLLHDIFWKKVEILRKYDMAFSGLGLGEHRFEYDIDNRFFDAFENSEVRNGSVKAAVSLIKNKRLLELEIHLHGDVEVVCDRCLDPFLTPVDDLRKLYVKFENAPSEISEDEDIIMISDRDHKINLAQHFYEFIHLCLPVRRIHPKDAYGIRHCNQEMIKILKEYSTDKHQQISETPWNQLKDVISDKNFNN